jgi:hypothetical protein
VTTDGYGRGGENAGARVCFLYIAQGHQVLHSISAACELARSRPDIAVDVFAATSEVLDYARSVAELTYPAPIGWRLLRPAWLRRVRTREGTPPKVAVLAANAMALGRYDVIVAPERTTALLRRLGVRSQLVYTQHGAGDRAGPFEPRLRAFDLVFAAGPKQRDRMLRQGLVAPANCAVVGYPKFDVVERLRPNLPSLFERSRPTVLYNPHFSSALGSWRAWGHRILEMFAAQDRYNLIFAPHVRLYGGRAPARVPELAPFLTSPQIHMDLGGSSAALDMTYTRLADIYVGDVSSQVYEFIRQPRPCLFLNPHHLQWAGNESFGHWSLGPVLDALDEFWPSLAEASETHALYREKQIESFDYTFDLSGETSSRRAARAIEALIAGGAYAGAGSRKTTSPTLGA